MPPRPPLRRPPLLLRSATWRLALAAVVSALLALLWHWAVRGGGSQ